MRKWLFAVFAMFVVFATGCATQQKAAAPATGGEMLAEIAPYDDAPVDPLPEMVPAE